MPKIDHALLCHFAKEDVDAFTVIMKGFVIFYQNVLVNKNLQIRQDLRKRAQMRNNIFEIHATFHVTFQIPV